MGCKRKNVGGANRGSDHSNAGVYVKNGVYRTWAQKLGGSLNS